MKKILCTLLALLLIMAMAIPAYACTEELPGRPQLPSWCEWLDWYKQWFPWLPSCEEKVELDAPEITESRYYHQGNMSRLQIDWGAVEDAEFYEVKVTKADGAVEMYTTETDLLYAKVECPRVYIEAENLWAAATVQVRAVAGDTFSEWSEAKKIGCDMLH